MAFFTLPPETRNQIYGELLVMNDPIFTGTRDPATVSGIRKAQVYPDTAVLRTCQRVYHEAAPLLYSRNRFELGYEITDEDILGDGIKDEVLSWGGKSARFLDTIGRQNAGLIRHLLIPFPVASTFPPFTMMPLDLQLAFCDTQSVSWLRMINHAGDLCSSLVTLETTADGAREMCEELERIMGLPQSLAKMDRVIRQVFPSLTEIVINRYDVDEWFWEWAYWNEGHKMPKFEHEGWMIRYVEDTEGRLQALYEEYHLATA